MKKITLSIYEYFYSRNELKKYKRTNKLMWLIANAVFRLCQFLLYYNLKIKYVFGCKPPKLNNNGNIIVSLTSFPARIDNVWMTIDSIMNQSVRPNRVILNLTQEEFPNGNTDLPNNILPYMDLGLEIAYRDSNLRSHLKYYYAIKDNPNSLVVTIDDDLYYPQNTIEKLMILYKQFPNAVCSNRTHEITFDKNNNINPYHQWTSNKSEAFSASHLLVALGYGGVLYPTNLFSDNRMFDKDVMKERCLKADDLWLKAFELLNDIPVVTGEYFCIPPEIRGSQVVSLMSSNCDTAMPQNDIQWNNLDSIYHINDLLKSKTNK